MSDRTYSFEDIYTIWMNYGSIGHRVVMKHCEDNEPGIAARLLETLNEMDIGEEK